MANIPSEILWHEGMLLLPQHFQQQDVRTEQLIDWRIGSTSPYSWGLVSMTIDLSALVHGHLRIQQLDSVAAEGSVPHDPQTAGAADMARRSVTHAYISQTRGGKARARLYLSAFGALS